MLAAQESRLQSALRSCPCVSRRPLAHAGPAPRRSYAAQPAPSGRRGRGNAGRAHDGQNGGQTWVGWRVRGEWHIRAWRAPKNGHAMRAILAATHDFPRGACRPWTRGRCLLTLALALISRGPAQRQGDQGATALVAGGEQTRGRGEAVLARPFDWRPTGGGKHSSSRASALGRA